MKMKTQVTVAAAMAMGLMSGGAMADMGAGTVTFTGTVSDAPCNIAAEYVDQTVPFGLISKSYLNAGNEVMKDFKIVLEKCDIATLKNVGITFYGPNNATGTEMQTTSGEAKNVAVRLALAGGDNITLGTATKDLPLIAGTNTLQFTAYAKKAAGAAGDVTEGKFESVADFRMSYK
ncbi:type 1 fimbrial protein [Salmonella enterica]|nr:type 1 fimbrial protein [Salmonella enterica subsp. enterica serovar Orientalis]EBJ4008369.1 type 1 fimbrial protein [Salmonella enterica]EBQ9235401.1 type 1 fimbrial protein [Salmonella enterica subsp. enterica serovar Orientalis]EKA1666419.1 type 1 fimbrial protein [Salmonella enterica]